MTTKKVSVGQVLEAMEANNVPHVRGTWFALGGPHKINGACILGCAAINLGITENSIEGLLNAAKLGAARTIMQYNDGTLKPYRDIVELSKELLKDKEHVVAECETAFYYSELKTSK